MAQTMSMEEFVGGEAQAPLENLGAPGTTLEDKAAGIMSEADVGVRTPGGKRSTEKPIYGTLEAETAPQKKEAIPQTMSIEDFTGGPQKGDWIDTAKKVGRGVLSAGRGTLEETAFLADMVGNLPSMGVGIGAEAMAKAMGYLAGESKKEADVSAQRIGQEASRWLSDPLQKALRGLGLLRQSGAESAQLKSAIGAAMELVETAGESAETSTGGAVTKEDILLGANTLMYGLGVRGVEAGRAKAEKAAMKKAGEGEKLSKEKVDEILAEDTLTETKPTSEDLVGQDAVWNARSKAYDLATRNASLKEVQAVIKNNPLVGKELDAFMARREAIREGPMKNVLQGEVLPPEKVSPGRASGGGVVERLPGEPPQGRLPGPAAPEGPLGGAPEQASEIRTLPDQAAIDAMREPHQAAEAANKVRMAEFEQEYNATTKLDIPVGTRVRLRDGTVVVVEGHNLEGAVGKLWGIVKGDVKVIQPSEVATVFTGPTPLPKRGPPSMYGKADPAVLALVAGAGLGWAYDGWEDVVPGAVLGFAAARLASSGWKGVAEAGGKYVGVPSTIIRGFSPAIADRWVRFEGTVRRRGHEAITQGDVFISKASKLPKAVQAALTSSLFSGDKTRTQTLLSRLGDKELSHDLSQLQTTLKSLGKELKSLGLIKGVIEDYFPRMVKDLPGLLNKLGVENKATLTKILSTARQDAFKRGDNLSQLEEASLVRNYLMGVYRKGKPDFTKSRVLEEIPEEFLPYYSSLAESYHTYANAAVASIEKAKFFGKAHVIEDGKTNLHQSIANLIAEELNSGKLPPEKVDTVAAIMRARFGPGERGPSVALQTVGDVMTLGLLGNFKATLTQVGDLATSAVVHGYVPTILALMKQAKGTRPITARELGFADYISEEFAGQATSTRAVNKTLKAVGFSSLDLMAKTTTVNAALIKSQRQLRTPEGQAKFTKRWGDGYTPQELQQLITDLQGKKITPLVKDYLFSEMSQTQPVSRAELPQAYLEHPDGRILYKMKSFTIKQLGLVHEEGIRKIARGEVKEGAAFLLRYATTLTVAGVPIAAVKAWLEDKPFDLPAAAMDNMLKTFGWSQYALEKMKEGKPVQGAWTLVAPPWKMFDEIASKDPKAWKYMPGVGFMLESRLMGGRERAEKLQKGRENKESDLYKLRKEQRELRKEMRGG